jgi:hypothetical protein
VPKMMLQESESRDSPLLSEASIKTGISEYTGILVFVVNVCKW